MSTPVQTPTTVQKIESAIDTGLHTALTLAIIALGVFGKNPNSAKSASYARLLTFVEQTLPVADALLNPGAATPGIKTA